MNYRFFMIWILLGLLVIFGCNAHSPMLLTSVVTVHIDDTMATCYSADDYVCLVVWHDMIRHIGSGDGHGSAGVTESAPRTTIRGDYELSSGRGFDYICATTDGMSGSMTVDGTDYDLSAGRVFLIQGGQDAVVVTQVAADMTRTGSDQDFLAVLAASDPAIKAFVASDD